MSAGLERWEKLLEGLRFTSLWLVYYPHPSQTYQKLTDNLLPVLQLPKLVRYFLDPVQKNYDPLIPKQLKLLSEETLVQLDWISQNAKSLPPFEFPPPYRVIHCGEKRSWEIVKKKCKNHEFELGAWDLFAYIMAGIDKPGFRELYEHGVIPNITTPAGRFFDGIPYALYPKMQHITDAARDLFGHDYGAERLWLLNRMVTIRLNDSFYKERYGVVLWHTQKPELV